MIIGMLKGADKFFKVYANVPISERSLPIVIIDEKPISWNLAYDEIGNSTEIGKKILKILNELNII